LAMKGPWDTLKRGGGRNLAPVVNVRQCIGAPGGKPGPHRLR